MHIIYFPNCKKSEYNYFNGKTCQVLYYYLLGRSTVREYAVEVAEKDPLMYGDGGLALTDASQVYCPESRVRLRVEITIMDK